MLELPTLLPLERQHFLQIKIGHGIIWQVDLPQGLSLAMQVRSVRMKLDSNMTLMFIPLRVKKVALCENL